MKHLVLFIFILLTLGSQAQYNYDIQKKNNLIRVVKDTAKAEDIYKSLVKYCVKQGLEFQTRDTDLFQFRTKPKKIEKGSFINVSYSVTVIDSVIYFRSFYFSDMSGGGYSGGISMTVNPTEERSYFSGWPAPKAAFLKLVDFMHGYVQTGGFKIEFQTEE